MPKTPVTPVVGTAAPAPDLAIEIDGQPLLLCAERAAFDPVSRSLLIADAHFGKGATFRVHGIPVPGGTTQDNLARLDTLIARHAPARIVFLGDLLHARPAQANAIVTAMQQWRSRHADLELVLVTGNHDRHAGAPDASLRIVEVEEPWRCGNWMLCHYPIAVPGAYVLAGHEHPSFHLRSLNDALRLPCFTIDRQVGILPAFGDFTGAHPVRPGARQRIFVVTGDQVVAIDRRHIDGMRQMRMPQRRARR